MTGSISGIKDLFADRTSSVEKITDVSQKIFSALDKDNDGNLSVAEQLSGGLTFAGKSLSKKDFSEIYVDFAEKALNAKEAMKDFIEEPNSPLSDSLRNELIKRLELARLTRNDFYKNEEEFISLKKDIKEGNWANYSAACKFLKYAAPYDNSKVQDGKIGFFKQRRLGDCWFLSQLMAYASTKDGENNIRKRIKTNPDGTYTVTLQHPNLRYQKNEEKYTITKNELAETAKKRKSVSGDIDVQILEHAFERYLKKHLPKDFFSEGYRDYFLEGGGDNSKYSGLKRLLVHRALGYTDVPRVYAMNNDGTQVVERKIIPIDLHTGEVLTKSFQTYHKNSYKDFSEVLKKNGYEPSECVWDTMDEDKYKNQNNSNPSVVMSHAYFISKISPSSFFFNNPHDSSKLNALSNESFNKHLRDMYYFPDKNISDEGKFFKLFSFLSRCF